MLNFNRINYILYLLLDYWPSYGGGWGIDYVDDGMVMMEMAPMPMPEMAMDGPTEASGAPVAEVAALQIRKDFPETWLWEDLLNIEWFVWGYFSLSVSGCWCGSGMYFNVLSVVYCFYVFFI